MCDNEWLQFCITDTYESKNNNNDKIPDFPEPSELYISTKSKIGYLSKELDIQKLFWDIPILSYKIPKEGIIKK